MTNLADRQIGLFPYEALVEINGRCVELMAEAARAPLRGRHPLLSQLQLSLMQLTPSVILRLSRSRILLVDLRFHDVPFWTAVASAARNSNRSGLSHPIFPRRSAAVLARATLSLAWHALHSSNDIASVVLGMHRDVSKLIASMRIADLDRIARQQNLELMPRWPELNAVWTGLLEAALQDDLNAQKINSLHWLQLAATED